MLYEQYFGSVSLNLTFEWPKNPEAFRGFWALALRAARAGVPYEQARKRMRPFSHDLQRFGVVFGVRDVVDYVGEASGRCRLTNPPP
jgi:hypothetical protein